MALPRALNYLRRSPEITIAGVALAGILISLVMQYALRLPQSSYVIPLLVVLVVGGVPLLLQLGRKLLARDFGSDLLAGISIATAALLGEFIVACIVILMLSGGEALEQYATRRASSILEALSRRMPNVAHRKEATGIVDIQLSAIAVGESLIVFPHELCPVDGVVTEGHGWMDESYLTGEPYRISKAPGSQVLSGAINGDAAVTIEASETADRFALRPHHARHARGRGEAAALAPARRSARCVVHADRARGGGGSAGSSPGARTVSWRSW